MQALRENPKTLRIILLVLFILAIVCLVGILLYNILFPGGDGVVIDTPTPPPTDTPEGPIVIVTPDEEPTPTPTKVIIEEPTSEPTEEPAIEPTEEPIEEPTATPTKDSGDLDLPIISPGAIADLLKNGDFEAGFDEQGVGMDWQSFKTDSVAAGFSSETTATYIKSGSSAQRITMSQAGQNDRYAGIHQQVNIVPSHSYTLELHGQIRTGSGDVNQSGYGYRMQYAIDHTGSANWLDVPAESWIELPWDEQLLDSSDVKFLDYTTEISSTSGQVTLFVRAWNKWVNPGEGQYTLDSLKLVGPSPTGTGGPEELINQPLPTTGAGDSAGFISSARFWGALLVLLLLAVGAIYRAKWSY